MNKQLLVLVLLAASCGGKLTVDRDAPDSPASGGSTEPASGGNRASEPNHAGGPNAAGSAPSGGGMSGAGSPSNNGGAAAIGGDPSIAGTPQAAGAGGDASLAGSSGQAGAPACEDVQDVPGDCHRTSCDDSGHSSNVVDQSDGPKPDNPCLAGTCNAAGKPGTTVRDARTACDDGAGNVMCDGQGACVQCTKTSDCGPKEYCSKARQCGPQPCTDVDCGGACPLCPEGKKCVINDDCQSNACDYVTHTCIANYCKDHHQDANETDADCGGGVCPGCGLTQSCGLDLDCASFACDVDTFTCISNQCADHRIDGNETDKDCGGGTCPSCAQGKKCKSDYDCTAGFCSVTIPRLCL